MAFTPTDQQRDIIESSLIPQCVVACAGSGKTATAVRRVLSIRNQLGIKRTYVALLSYSNVAVDTFRAEFANLAAQFPALSRRVFIGTVDSFVVSNILQPHGASAMGAARQPFLVNGGEPFLNSYKIYNGEYSESVMDLAVRFNKDGGIIFYSKSNKKIFDKSAVFGIISKLAKVGAYTHELGRYWAINALVRQERLLSILARRYSHILVDEAQDIGSSHGKLLSLLRGAGSCVSLIGDPNQAIFEFADADGSFLKDFSKIDDVFAYPLSENRRSVEHIVAVANRLSNTTSKAIRSNPSCTAHGANYIKYDKRLPGGVSEVFLSVLSANGYATADAAILCRGRSLIGRLGGGSSAVGQGATARFAEAAIGRDSGAQIPEFFSEVLVAVLKLLEGTPNDILRQILAGSREAVPRSLRRFIWDFIKDPDRGLPSAHLSAKAEWHSTLKARLPKLLTEIETLGPIKRSPTWKNKVTAAKLGDLPLLSQKPDARNPVIRVSTVHQAKGESIGAVLYVVTKKDLKSLIEGVKVEDGRIGYVALTRAKDFFLLAVPSDTEQEELDALDVIGFRPWIDARHVS